MPNNYPTKEVILAEEQMFKPELIKKIKEWKKASWKNAKTLGADDKFTALQELIMLMATIYSKPVGVQYTPEIRSCCYVPMTQTIYINDSVSIISTMHEFAHHLFGADETKACKWSVWLFKKTFSKAFEQLVWKGHMLTKRNPLMEYEVQVQKFLTSQGLI
jgi:hypothetical protein